ncbi:MAG: AMP-binding protein, partial [Firmicutes bacterium]|nr:AMP-binding protein [Bacillota bacterium]
TDHDTSIALLPYHHIFGSTGQWVVIASGSRTVYCDGLKYLQKNLKEYGVSIFIGVPLIIEAMYKKVLHTAEKNGKLATLEKGRKISRFLLKCGIDVRRKLFKEVLDGLGGKLRFVIIGAAPINPESLQAFTDFGICTVQGYGLTETSPVVSAERHTHIRAGSVGIAMEGNTIKISEPNENGIGEITVKGENVMLGYLNNPEATAAVLKDGWFYTGDLGYMDKDGYLYITGRKKNVIVLKNGKNVFPEELEALLEKKPYQKELVVLGVPRNNDPKNLAVTLKIVYNEEYFEGKTFEEIDEFIKEDIDQFNEQVPPYKRIMRVIVTDGELIKTTTGKVKRYAEVEEILKKENAQEE